MKYIEEHFSHTQGIDFNTKLPKHWYSYESNKKLYDVVIINSLGIKEYYVNSQKAPKNNYHILIENKYKI